MRAGHKYASAILTTARSGECPELYLLANESTSIRFLKHANLYKFQGDVCKDVICFKQKYQRRTRACSEQVFELELLTMGADNLQFKDPATARAYIRNLAIRFDDPEDMFAFLKTCDIAQAALAYWLIEANRYDRIQKSQCIRGVISERESEVELEGIWNEYRHASEEFQLVKENLKKIISKLDEHNLSEIAPNKLGFADSPN